MHAKENAILITSVCIEIAVKMELAQANDCHNLSIEDQWGKSRSHARVARAGFFLPQMSRLTAKRRTPQCLLSRSVHCTTSHTIIAAIARRCPLKYAKVIPLDPKASNSR
jgi:hypothetical protein